ncbi:unnamed protein product [Anisakis simplex]|uniref:Uncharacterized protein n=1 Tax=Anisakis simplex TaxID=6269 RepID=A0A0M3KFJ1_ANISI|nr:unnamed protein product [Anisakis simplex]
MPSKLSAQGNTIPLLMHSAPASVLIGVDQMNEVINLLSVKKLPSGFTLLESRLGMVLNGRVKQFWKLELMGITENPTITADDVAIQKFREGTKFNDGRYYIRWRWKEGERLLRETECQTGKATTNAVKERSSQHIFATHPNRDDKFLIPGQLPRSGVS